MYSPQEGNGLVSIFMSGGTILIIATVMCLAVNPDWTSQRELREEIERRTELLASLKARIARAKAELHHADKKFKADKGGLEVIDQQWEIVEGRMGRALSERSFLLESITDLRTKYEAYAETMEARTRAASVGRHMGDLTTNSGKVFRSAVIREVKDGAIVVVHENGVSTIGAGELPERLYDRFHWDEEAVGKGIGITDHRVHGDPQSLSSRPGSNPATVADRNVLGARERLRRAGVIYYGLVRQYGETERLSRTSNSRSAPGKLDTWGQRLTSLRQELGNARIEYHNARTELMQLAPNDVWLVNLPYYRPYYWPYRR